jgi:uncharacterized glyoxalase superfamily protein PhnB
MCAGMSISVAFGSAANRDDPAARCAEVGPTTKMGPINSFWGKFLAVVRDPFVRRWALNGRLG